MSGKNSFKNDFLSFFTILFVFFPFYLLAQDTGIPQNYDRLKINPLQLVSLKEVLNIANTLGNEFYPGLVYSKIPVLFYRPNVQELLINFPHKPKGYFDYTGFSLLADEIMYVKNDTTVFDIDDQNTCREIEGIPVLIVADYFSRMRSQISSTVRNQDKDFIYSWLNNWNFIPSPYFDIELILHEGFHVFQDKMAPDKYANEAIVTVYPLLDAVNNSLYVLEGNILRDALLADNTIMKQEKIKEFAAVRTYRQARLKREVVEYENLNEYVEGTAKYIEYKFMNIGEKVVPIKEMYYQNGFEGYKEVLFKQFREEMENMVKIVSVSDNRFGNKYGTGPMRFRLYFLGACQALLLDDILPEWKTKIFKDNVYLCDLLNNSLKLKEPELNKYLEKAKADYNYSEIYRDKIKFEQEGKSIIKEKLSSILNTKNTLVTISYSNYPDKIGMAYTPFGVTQVSETSAIYDLVPIEVLFNKNTKLKLKKVTPVYLDKYKKEISFAVVMPASNLETYTGNSLDTDEFNLSDVKTEIKREGNHITILLK